MNMHVVIHRSRRSAKGVALLEVLVALLIFAFGVLGIVGLQASMTKAQTSSKLRGDAAYLAQEFMGNMWADFSNLGKYNDTDCAGHAPCNAVKVKVASRLPGGAVAFDNQLGGLVEIRITWTPPGEEQHVYRTETAIQR